MKVLMNYRIKKAAIKVLRKYMGWKTLLALVSGMNRRKKQGEPWNGFPEPADQKDRESRALIEDAILLYRELQLRVPKPDAERIIRELIIESAVMQLYTLVPHLELEKIRKLTPENRQKQFCEIINQFPNADWQLGSMSETQYSYLIHRCRLVELIMQAGHEELKDAFCNGDGVYFERYQPEIQFYRPKKIGSGYERCEFQFGIAEKKDN